VGVAKEEGEEMSNADKFIGKIRAVGIEPTDFLLLEINPEHIYRWASLSDLRTKLSKAGFHNVSILFCSEHMKITSVKKVKGKKKK